MQRPAPSVPASMLTIKDVAKQLTLSTKTVRRMITAGSLPYHRVGRLIRIAPHDLAILVHVSRAMSCSDVPSANGRQVLLSKTTTSGGF